ncbi:hypothetical protein A6A40_19605 (plasmid) [Azospirillum humicireducens]|uniref:Uncharacterized protein n=1 Tax=Azospirillum humicireducens TaxID=1226968 RepID=A0A2R4VS50_9PROT|nr:hypothetical protein A6A40_19605 [Azospirillum humicireducens]
MAVGGAIAVIRPADGGGNVCVLPCRAVSERRSHLISYCFCSTNHLIFCPDSGRNAPWAAPDWQNDDVRTIRRRPDSRPILRRFPPDGGGVGERKGPLFGRTATFAAGIRRTRSSGSEESFGTTATFRPESFGTTATLAAERPTE